MFVYAFVFVFDFVFVFVHLENAAASVQVGSKEPRLTFVWAHSHANVLTVAWFCLALLLFHTFVFIFVSTFVFVFVCVLSPFPCNCPDYDLVLTSSVDFFLLFNLATKMIAVQWDQTGGLLSSHFARFAHFADNCHQTWCHHGASVITIRDVINCLTPFHYWDTDTTAGFNLPASSSSRSRISTHEGGNVQYFMRNYSNDI